MLEFFNDILVYSRGLEEHVQHLEVVLEILHENELLYANLAPFRLSNAPSTFQALMNQIFKPYVRRFVLEFFNDILVYSRGLEEHVQHLEVVLEILRENELLYANLDKCSFAKARISYLGHFISEKGIEVDSDKIKTIREWPVPPNVREVRGFLVSWSYLSRTLFAYGHMPKYP